MFVLYEGWLRASDSSRWKVCNFAGLSVFDDSTSGDRDIYKKRFAVISAYIFKQVL